MKVLNMCDYCVYKVPECDAERVSFGIDLQEDLDEERLNDAVIGCDTFEDNGERGVLYIKA